MLKQMLLSPTCLNCGSIFNDESLFCNLCAKNFIVTKTNTPCITHLPMQHLYLINWNNDDYLVKELAYRLKSGLSKSAIKYYTELLFKKIQNQINFLEFKFIVPIPGSKPDSIHAKLIANELSILTGLPVLDILVKKEHQKVQKTKSLAERKLVQFTVVKSAHFELFTPVIFVDDVLASGESFIEAKRAIQSANLSMILTLFYRSLN